MDFATLALIGCVGLLGPLLAAPDRWHLPLTLGELAGGAVFGISGFAVLHPGDPTFTFLADIGFALVMFVAGSHVPVGDARLRPALLGGALRAALVGVVAAALGVLVAQLFQTEHAALYAVLMASSSAALVLPAIDSLRLGGPKVLTMIAQIGVADAVCIVALPLVIDPSHAARAALGSVVVLAAVGVVALILRYLERNGARHRLHRLSEHRRFALELRINLILLFGLAALAQWSHVSVLLAGFGLGLAVATIGPPRRLARQLFAITEGFFGPLFFVWLGASLDLRALVDHPSQIGLGVVLGVGAVVAHLVTRLAGSPVSLALLTSAQLGVPVAAATLGTQLGLLSAAEPAALIVGALVTVAACALGGNLAVRAGLLAPPKPNTAPSADPAA